MLQSNLFHFQHQLSSSFLLFGKSSIDIVKVPQWIAFQKEWDNLSLDNYMQDRGKYRFRRYGKMILKSKTREIRWLENTDFYQNCEVNPVNGGQIRSFSQILPSTLQNYYLEKIVWEIYSILPNRKKYHQWEVGVHMIRIIASHNQQGKPTPEGMHRDGHDYVAQILINRENILGGESTLQEIKSNQVRHRVLQNPLDAIIIDDHNFLHGVSTIRMKKSNYPSFRDMLILDFNH